MQPTVVHFFCDCTRDNYRDRVEDLLVHSFMSELRVKVPVSCVSVPTASSRFYHIKGRTTYDRHYNDNADNVVTQIREVGQKLGQEALQKYLEKTEGQGRYLSKATVVMWSVSTLQP